MNRIIVLLMILLWMIEVQGQSAVNAPILYKDSLNITSISIYQVDNFISTDTVITEIELDEFARIKKSSTYAYGRLIKEIEHISAEDSKLFIRTVTKQEVDIELEIPAITYTKYEYDENDNIVKEVSESDSFSIVSETRYKYNSEGLIEKIIYDTVPSRFRGGKPNGTFDSYEYDIQNNKVKIIRTKPNGSKRVRSEGEIQKKRYDLSKIINNQIEFIDEVDRRKTRTVFKFDERMNIIRQEGFLQIKNKDGVLGKEYKVFTTINKIKYRMP